MPSWKKVIVSGSDATLNSLIVSNGITGSLQGTSSFATTSTTASYVLNAVSASRSVSASFATSASFVTNLNQNVLITGSATIGATSSGASENTLTLGARDVGSEGGQIGFNAPGGTYTSASFIDLYQNKLRILKGTNVTSTGEVARWDMHNAQMGLPAYTSPSSFTGTVAGLLAFDSSGNILTTAAGGTGTVTSVGGNGTVNGITLTGTVTTSGNLTLGGTLSGISNSQLTNSSITIGSTTISLGSTSTTLAGLTSVTSTAFTGSLQGSASYANTSGTTSAVAGTTNYVPKFATATTLGNSQIFDNGTSVGIGTTTPGALLQLGNVGSSSELLRLSTAYSSDRSAKGGITWRDATDTTGRIYTEYDGTMVSMVFGSLYNSGYNSNNLMIIRGNGYVGIGTISPGYQLEVNGWVGASRYYPYSSNGTFIMGDGSGLEVAGNGYFYSAATNGSYFEGNVRIRGGLSNDTAAYMQINGGTSAITFINGYLGVGTSAISARIDTNGSIASNSGLTNASTRPAVSAGTLTNGEFRGYSSTSTGADDGFSRISAGGGTNANTKSYIDISGYSTVSDMDRNIVFGTSGTERMRLTTAGNLGLGTTSPIVKLHTVNNDNAYAVQALYENTNSGSNALAGIGLKTTSQGTFSIFQLNSSGDAGLYNTSTSGKMNFFTNSLQRMTINSVGKVGIGTTSPTYDLEVNGTIAVANNILDITNNNIKWYNTNTFYAGGYDIENNVDYQTSEGVTSVTDYNKVTSTWGIENNYNGQVLYGVTAGATILRGQLVRLRNDGKWYTTDASTASTSTTLLGICLTSAGTDGTSTVLLDGIINISYHTQNGSANAGAPLYIETSTVGSAGDVTEVAPTATNEIVRLIGHTLYETGAGKVAIRFQPDNTWIEL